MMINARINNVDCKLFYDERIPAEKAPSGYPHMYHLRHDENNWCLPISIEKFVFANFFGTIFTKTPFEFDKDGYIDVEQFEMEPYYIIFEAKGELLERALGIKP
jgi:hypothetical protein